MPVINQQVQNSSKNDNLYYIFSRQHHHNLNNHELQQLVDPGFQSLDINPKDGLLEHDELSKLFDIRDTDGTRELLFFSIIFDN